MAETAHCQSSYDVTSLRLLSQTLLTSTYKLLELELFIRPFEKLIRVAIQEGAQHTVSNTKGLIEN
jgi:hypothetical protein